MIRYAILSSEGIVVGLGDAFTVDDMIASAPPGMTTTGLGDDECPTAMQDYLGADERFHPLPQRPGAWAKWSGSEWGDPRTEADLQREVSAQWAALRAERDRLLAASDWTDLPSARLTDAQRAAWRAYRAALFDLPETTQDPAAPIWPAKP